MGQSRLPLLRSRLRDHDGHQQGADRFREGRPEITRQSRAHLHQGLLQRQDPIRRGSPHEAAAPQEKRRVRQEREVYAGQLGRGFRCNDREVQGVLRGARTLQRLDLRIGPVHHRRGLRGREVHEGRRAFEQHRPQCAALHGFGRGGLHSDLRDRRAARLLRRHRTDRRGGLLGRQHGGVPPDTVVARDGSQDQAQADADREPLDLQQPHQRHRRPRDDLRAADRPRNPELHRALHDRARGNEPEVRRQTLRVRHGAHRHRLRPARRPPPRAGTVDARQGRRPLDDHLRRVQKESRPLYGEARQRAVRAFPKRS